MPCFWLSGQRLDQWSRLLWGCRPSSNLQGLWALADGCIISSWGESTSFFSTSAYQSCSQKTSDCPEHQGPEQFQNQRQFFPKLLSGPSLYTFLDWLSPTFSSVSSCLVLPCLPAREVLASFCGPAVTAAVLVLSCQVWPQLPQGRQGTASKSNPTGLQEPLASQQLLRGAHTTQTWGVNPQGVNFDQKGRWDWERLAVAHSASFSPTDSSNPWRHPKWVSEQLCVFSCGPVASLIMHNLVFASPPSRPHLFS